MESLGLIGDLGLNVVEEAEVERCREIFIFYDEDNDGKLTYAEILTALRSCGRNPSVHEFKEMLTEVDTKLDGALDFDHFMCLFVMQLKEGPNDMQELIDAFQAFDKQGSGFIMSDDLKKVLTTMGNDRLTDEEADMMVKLADKDGDGVLDYDEIISMIQEQHNKIENARSKMAVDERLSATR